MRKSSFRGLVATGILVCIGIVVVGASMSQRWIGGSFPGFVLLANRVVASISLPSWGESPPSVFQHQILEVDGVSVSSSTEVYDLVAAQPIGNPIEYTIRAPNGAVSRVQVPSRFFSAIDFLLLFGSYLFCAVTFLCIGWAIFLAQPDDPAGRGLLSACLGLGLYAATGMDLYGPSWHLFRVHVVAETLFPAGLIHLALVFPRDRLGRNAWPSLIGIYAPFVALALLYQCVLYWPTAYTAAHLLATIAQGVAGLFFLLVVARDLLTSESELVRWRIGVVGVGAVLAFASPAILSAASGLLSGTVPVNMASFTAFLFPLSLAYAIKRRSLVQDGFFARKRNLAYVLAVPSWLRDRLRQAFALLRLSVAACVATRRRRSIVAGILSVPLLALTVCAGVNSIIWVDRSFPGFFVMENRVIPSVALSSWGADTSALFQHQVVAVDGISVATSKEVYDLVARVPVGTVVKYSLLASGAVTRIVAVPTRRFTEIDWAGLFGPFLLTGVSFLACGLLVFLAQPTATVSWGFLSLGLIGGLFVITATDLYGPHWFFRVHAMAEALVPATLLHLALVFPTDRLSSGFRPLMVSGYAMCLIGALLYEVWLGDPTAYSAFHLACLAAQGVAGTVLLWAIAYDLLTTTSIITRQRILAAAVGAVMAFMLPTLLMGASGLSNGSVAVNAAAFTGFAFPMCLAYALVRDEYPGMARVVQQVSTLCLALAGAYLSCKSRFLS